MSRFRQALIIFFIIGAVNSVVAVERLSVLALFETKALLHIDGVQRILNIGQSSPEGVTLIDIQEQQAIVEINGVKEVLTLGMVSNFPGIIEDDDTQTLTSPEEVTLWAQDDGFFYARGEINGFAVRFLVDTGANTIAINRFLAERLDIDYRRGKRGVATTASGIAEMYLVNLDRVTIGGITLRDIEAGVLTGPQPDIPLLGMSFLQHLDMVRQGNRLDLKRRY